MGKILFIVVVSLFFSFSLNGQQQSNTEPEKSFQIGIGGGVKYYFKETNIESGQGNDLAISIELAKDFWKTRKHFLGIDLIGYNYKHYGNKSVSTKFLYYLNFIYKRKNGIYKNMTFELDLGLSVYNNSVDEGLLGPIINAKIAYQLCCFEIFIKNSFRWEAFFWKEKPWLLSAGISTQI